MGGMDDDEDVGEVVGEGDSDDEAGIPDLEPSK